MTKIAIVILHYKGLEVTEECLQSLSKLKIIDFQLEVIVVNNNPEENLGRLSNDFKKFIFLNTGKNLGFCGGNNYGIRFALERNNDYVFILNNDTLVAPDLIINLLSVFKKEDKIGIVSPKIYFAKGYEYHKERYRPENLGKVIWYAGGKFDWDNILGAHIGVNEIDIKQFDQQSDIDFATGCAMMVRRQVFEKVGLFDESLFMYLEDIDFCQRAKRAGIRIVYFPAGALWHKNAISGGSGRLLQDYFMSRNRLIIGMRYAKFRTKLALIREAIRLLFIGREWQKVGVRDYFMNIRGVGSWKS